MSSYDNYTGVLVKSLRNHRKNQILFIEGGDGLSSKRIFFFIHENLDRLQSDDALRFWMENVKRMNWSIAVTAIDRHQIKYNHSQEIVEVDKGGSAKYHVINNIIHTVNI